jgi:hypothetical protein
MKDREPAEVGEDPLVEFEDGLYVEISLEMVSSGRLELADLYSAVGVRQFKSEAQLLTVWRRILQKEFDSQAIFLVYGLLIRQLSLTPLASQS